MRSADDSTSCMKIGAFSMNSRTLMKFPTEVGAPTLTNFRPPIGMSVVGTFWPFLAHATGLAEAMSLISASMRAARILIPDEASAEKLCTRVYDPAPSQPIRPTYPLQYSKTQKRLRQQENFPYFRQLVLN